MKRVLYIEDNPFTQRVVKEHLNQVGEVWVASSLAQGRDLLRQEPFDLLISDVFLPDGNAVDLVRETRSDRSPEQLPIILVSSSMDQLLRSQAFRAGANECFPMPTPWQTLVDCVKNMLEHPYVVSTGQQQLAVTLVQGRIDGQFWVFCPELNLHLAGEDLNALREKALGLVREKAGGGCLIPYVSHVAVSEHLITIGPGLNPSDQEAHSSTFAK